MQKVLTIAGTDPTGGAGIQADLKTFTAHKVYGMSIITALVAQNTMGVKSIYDISPPFIGEQFDCVFQDIVPDAIKIGMVSQIDVIKTIVEKLKQYNANNIVVDPVMVATSGDKLLSEDAIAILKDELMPLASIITPNLKEAQVLVNHDINSKDEMISAAKEISAWFTGYILIKGGHFADDSADDLLYYNDDYLWFETKRIDNPNNHGTGCTLSSAIASNLALGYDMKASVQRAKEYISGALNDQLDLGKGSGPLNHCWNM